MKEIAKELGLSSTAVNTCAKKMLESEYIKPATHIIIKTKDLKEKLRTFLKLTHEDEIRIDCLDEIGHFHGYVVGSESEKAKITQEGATSEPSTQG
jgi:DNA-binding Lrp family transcriptional regulator